MTVDIALKSKVLAILKDDTLGIEGKQEALIPLMKEHLETYNSGDEISTAFNDWNMMVADLVEMFSSLRTH